MVHRCLALFIVLIFFCRDAEGGSWCVASPSATQLDLQKGLDYACGIGGADCAAIQPGASCFIPNTLHDHASYAYNSYYQKAPAGSTCSFSGSAILTITDPSTPTCKYPSMKDAHSLRFSNFNYEQPDARVFMVTAIMECALMFVMFVRGEMGRKLKSDCMPEQATVPRCLSPPPNIRAHHRPLPR